MAIRLTSITRVCPGCGADFHPWQSTQAYCSVHCQLVVRWENHERGKRACHLEARKHLKRRCEGVRPSGRACTRISGLHVHHRDSNWRNNAEDNLQTLCRGCHVRAHGKKTWRDNNRRLKGRAA